MTTVTTGTMGVMTNANDRFGRNTGVREPTGYGDQVAATAATPFDYTIPAGAAFIFISVEDGGNYWVKPNGSGARPTATKADGTAWDFKPLSYKIEGSAVSTLRIETAGTTVVHLECYRETNTNNS